jgi:hypothetical protein
LKTRASGSLVIADAVPDRAWTPAPTQAHAVERPARAAEGDRQRVDRAGVGVADRHMGEWFDCRLQRRRLARHCAPTAGSLSITLVALSTTGAPPALLKSLGVKVVVVDVFGAPFFGMKIRASSSLVVADAVPVSV